MDRAIEKEGEWKEEKRKNVKEKQAQFFKPGT
ncbi:MAG: hypothetical protein ACI945_002312 [Pseudohongiellaceae bacterium]|jgi:hypothetical protein